MTDKPERRKSLRNLQCYRENRKEKLLMKIFARDRTTTLFDFSEIDILYLREFFHYFMEVEISVKRLIQWSIFLFRNFAVLNVQFLYNLSPALFSKHLFLIRIFW